MPDQTRISHSIATLAMALVFSASAQADEVRTFVSTTGDENTSVNCSPAARWRTFAVVKRRRRGVRCRPSNCCRLERRVQQRRLRGKRRPSNCSGTLTLVNDDVSFNITIGCIFGRLVLLHLSHREQRLYVIDDTGGARASDPTSAAETFRRQHALVVPQAGRRTGRQQIHRAAHSGASQTAADLLSYPFSRHAARSSSASLRFAESFSKLVP